MSSMIENLFPGKGF